MGSDKITVTMKNMRTLKATTIDKNDLQGAITIDEGRPRQCPRLGASGYWEPACRRQLRYEANKGNKVYPGSGPSLR